MGTSLTAVLALLPWLQSPTPLPQGPAPELVLVREAGERLGPDCRLGDGGFAVAAPVAAPGSPLQGHQGDGRTPGGAVIQCRREGVKLTLPSGRELLFAPDGFLHLRSGELAGPYVGGVCLELLDGSSLRIVRASSRRMPLSSVLLCRGERAVRLWDDDDPDDSEVPSGAWAGDRLWCFGDGGALYRAIALGPLVTLSRVLAPKQESDGLPASRLVLATAPVCASMHSLMEARPKRVERETTPEVRAVADAAERIFVVDERTPARVDGSRLRYALRLGFQVQFDLEGDLRMQLFHGQADQPMFVWRLGYGAEVSYGITMLRLDRQDETFQRMSRPVKLPAAAPALAARSERRELVEACAVLRSLTRDR